MFEIYDKNWIKMFNWNDYLYNVGDIVLHHFISNICTQLSEKIFYKLFLIEAK